MAIPTSLERVVAQDRGVVVGGLVTLTMLAWVYLFSMAADMAQMGDAMLTASATPWTATEFVLMFLMWSIMMVGMMLPSAAPMILLFAAVNRRRVTRGQVVTPTAVFAGGYTAVWTAFSVVATLLQWLLHRAGLLSPMMVTLSAVLGRCGAHRGWPLPMDSVEKQLSTPLPVAPPVHHPPLARGNRRRVSDGSRARSLLSRVLLVPDMSAVRRRRDEPVVDRRTRVVRTAREASTKPVGPSNQRRPPGRVGSFGLGRQPMTGAR